MLRRRGLKPRNALVTIDIKVLTDLYRCIARDRPSRYVIMARETRSHARVACEGPRSTSEDTGTGGWLYPPHKQDFQDLQDLRRIHI